MSAKPPHEVWVGLDRSGIAFKSTLHCSEREAIESPSLCIGDGDSVHQYILAAKAAQEYAEMKAENERLREKVDDFDNFLRRHGFVKCAIPEYNCESWHQQFGWPERFNEIDEATQDDWRNGETLLLRVERIARDRADLKAENERLREKVKALGEALEYSLQCVLDWSSYVDKYFTDKHDLAGDLAKIRAALAALEVE